VEPGQICSDSQIVALTERNTIIQFDEIRLLAAEGWADPSSVSIDIMVMKRLHMLATMDIFDFAGQLRDGPVYIQGTGHVPPPPEQVLGESGRMMAYIGEHWSATPIHLCAYVLWRCNWIHPFFNGNGRTTRGLAYLTFLLRLGYEPGGRRTFIDMISENKQPYYDALDCADAAWKRGTADVSDMERVVTENLARQLG